LFLFDTNVGRVFGSRNTSTLIYTDSKLAHKFG
jgi:hypothetical protein